MGIFLLVIVLLSFAWIWRVEMRETAQEGAAKLDLQRARLDIDLTTPVKAIQEARFLSTASLSSERYQQALKSIVRENESIESLRVLDNMGRELLRVNEESIEDPQASTDPSASANLSDEYLEELRSLSAGEIMISDFFVVPSRGRLEPKVFIGTGLFFASGARAGYIVVDVLANQILEDVAGLLGNGNRDLSLISADGRWIYDSSSEDPWASLKDTSQSRWILDEHPNVWRAMISSGDGSYSEEGLWIFREHIPLETNRSKAPRVLTVDSAPIGAINADPFFIVRQVSDKPSWHQILMVMIPIVVLFILAIVIVVPAMIRKQRALRLSQQASRDLSDASLRTRMAMEAAGISEWRIDFDGGVVETDKRMAGMLLLGPGEGIRTVEDWEGRIHPQDRSRVIDELEQRWGEGKGTFSLRHRMKRGDESWGWYRFRGAVRTDEFDHRKFILGAYIDLTDVVLRDAELNRLELATRQTLSGIAILDQMGSLEWANPAFRDHPERQGKEILGKPIWELFVFSGNQVAEEQETMRSAVIRGTEFSLVVARASGGEEAFWSRVVGNPVLDEGGIPTNYLVIESDISREMRVESDLRKSESLLLESQRLASIGSWEIDPVEDTVFWSNEVYRIFGVSRDSTMTLDLALDLFDREDREAMAASVKEAIETGKGFEREAMFRRPDGQTRWAFAKGMALREGGVTTKLYGIVQDISAQKDSETALVRAKEEAEVLNGQLAGALDKARDSEKKAQEASEAKSSFLSMISHEIRNPMNGVIGMADLLRQTELDEVQADYVETIHSSGSTVVMLLDDILDFNRLEHGKIQFEHKEFSLDSAVEESVLFFSPKLVQKGVDFAYWIDPEVPKYVIGDITRVKQILFNLLGNAVKFTDGGSITVEVELRERRQNDRCLLLFTVKDTGIGIPENRHDRIFQSFSQVDPSITRKFGGSGLGLAISKELSLRMGGDIEFESEEGEGTCFEVLLPFSASHSREPVQKRKGGGHVLVWTRLTTREKQCRSILEQAGLSVEFFSDSEGLVAAIREAAPDVWIFIDYKLLEGDASLLVALESRPTESNPVVVISVPGQKTEFRFPVVWLTKPVSEKRVLSILEGSTGKKKIRTADPMFPEKSESNNDMRILVAEDNLVNQKVIRLLLKRLGYDCTVVENGARAVEKVMNESFDLVLMDIQMPEMDGIEASGKIVEAIASEKRPRIVALTAGATRDNREDAEEAGMDGYLTKPVQAGALEQELQATSEFLAKRG
ncbi:response regulator [Puniceicoccus vermicola]|uniref:histidine kinase n=2 Tax=Puniceicoccus vermicola TaxID=388746 RepID=A0A7X1E4C7_9BACT|nr:response regulator [Puniceicoccus vermicola]